MNKRIKVEAFGVKENAGKGYTCWIKAGEDYYNMWCGNEEEGKKLLADLKEGDTVIISYVVKGQWKNFTTIMKAGEPLEKQGAPPQTAGKPSIPKPPTSEERGAGNQAEADAVHEYYVTTLKEARSLVEEGMGRKEVDPIFPIVAAVFEKIATPMVYLLKDMRRKK